VSVRQIVVRVDVSEAVGLGEPLHALATVCLPDAVHEHPVVCFGFPGGGYSRRYFTFDMPGAEGEGQAGWHTSRDWIFVACDPLHTGESSLSSDPTQLTYEHLVAANHAMVEHLLELLAGGSLAEDVPPIIDPVKIGIGQSMGGSILVLQQGQRATFDAIGVLGWSGRHAVSWLPPGTPTVAPHYFPRGTDMGALTRELHTTAMPAIAPGDDGMPLTMPGFHFDDVPRDIVRTDMIDYPNRGGNMPVWGCSAIPPCAMTMMSPGAVAPEAANITVPVLIAVGERDVCPDPLSEPQAYERASDITVFVCPRMAHMHNFAGTRELMWARIHAWGEGVAALKPRTKGHPKIYFRDVGRVGRGSGQRT
jgi:pimeloyl-ACP methyl ester carboxylesterase